MLWCKGGLILDPLILPPYYGDSKNHIEDIILKVLVSFLFVLSTLLLSQNAAAKIIDIYDSGNIQVGYVSDSGDVYHSGNIQVGYVSQSGDVYDSGNIQVGFIAESGDIYDSGNIQVGYLSKSGDVYHSGNVQVGYILGDMDRRIKGGSALLLLLKK